MAGINQYLVLFFNFQILIVISKGEVELLTNHFLTGFIWPNERNRKLKFENETPTAVKLY